jgi:gliding motility-associated-like protein
MKDGLENIDEIFKQAFDGFESNVDPSVWNNIQNSIASGSGGGSTPQIEPSAATSVVGKSLALKIVAGVAIVGTVVTSTYYIVTANKENKNVVVENVLPEEYSSENVEKSVNSVELENRDQVESDVFNEKPENAVINNSVKTGEQEEQNNNVQENQNNNLSVDNALPNENAKNVVDKKQNETVVVDEKPTQTAVIVEEKLEVKINANTIKGKAPLTVQFDAYGNGVQYFWDFRDNSDEVNEESPIHVFQSEGTYNVTLTGIDKNGNSKSVNTTIVVEKDYSSSIAPIQNYITPNGDNQNDIIKIKGKNIDNIQVNITDIKGKLVYFMNSLDDVWEGKDQSGNALIQGQYLITVVAMGKDGKEHVKRSFINLRE